jgi:AcrR family transcriptional regulator
MKMNGYEIRTQAKKDRIVSAARALFTERGMSAVSMNEIAKMAKVSQVSIYNYFGDKNTLAKEAFISYIEEAIQKYEQIIEENIPFAEKIGLIVQDKSHIIDALALSHFDEQALNDKVLQQIFQEAIKEKAIVLYTKFIELGKKEGAIDTGIPTEAVVSYFMISMSIFQQPDFISTDSAYKRGMMKLFLYGLIGDKNPPDKQA